MPLSPAARAANLITNAISLLPGDKHSIASGGCAVAGDSSKLLTGSGDSSAKLWDMETGKDLFTFKYHEPCRAVAFSLGDGMAAISSDPFIGAPAAIHLVTIAGAVPLCPPARAVRSSCLVSVSKSGALGQRGPRNDSRGLDFVQPHR